MRPTAAGLKTNPYKGGIDSFRGRISSGLTAALLVRGSCRESSGFRPFFHADSPLLTPIGADDPQSHTVATPPLAYGSVLFVLGARADLGEQNERVHLRVSDVPFGSTFSLGASDCPVFEDFDSLVVEAALFNAVVAGGDARADLVFSSTVDSSCVSPSSFIYFALVYGDCNSNGILDECEIAAGLVPDQNGNGVPDSCE